MAAAEREVLIRGPDELAEEIQLVEDTVEDIGNKVDRDLSTRKVDASDFSDLEDFDEVYRDVDGPRDFESSFSMDERAGLNGGNITSVLLMQPFADHLRETPVIYVTDRPLFAEDYDTGEIRHVYGVTRPGSSRNAAALSTFAFQEMDDSLQDAMLETLAYHEGGHLLNEEDPDRDYRDEDSFGGGHCTNPDVMTGTSIWQDTKNRYEQETYCDLCEDEIRNGLDNL